MRSARLSAIRSSWVRGSRLPASSNCARPGVAAQCFVAGAPDRRRPQRGQRGHPVVAGLQPHVPVPDGLHQPLGGRSGVDAGDRPPHARLQRRSGLTCGSGQHRLLDLAALRRVVHRAGDLDHDPRVRRGDVARSQGGEGGGQALDQRHGVDQQQGRRSSGDAERRRHFVDGPLADVGQCGRPGRDGTPPTRPRAHPARGRTSPPGGCGRRRPGPERATPRPGPPASRQPAHRPGALPRAQQPCPGIEEPLLLVAHEVGRVGIARSRTPSRGRR